MMWTHSHGFKRPLIEMLHVRGQEGLKSASQWAVGCPVLIWLQQGLQGRVWKDTSPACGAGKNLTHETGPDMSSKDPPAAATLPLNFLHPR